MRIRNALRKFDWKGWLGWVIATMVGVQLAAFTIIFSVFNLNDQRWSGIATATVAGGALGGCQWIWLRRRLDKGEWWIVSTLVGWYLVWFLGTMQDLYPSNGTGTLRSLVDSVGPLTLPLVFSLPQWVFIRRQFRKAAWLWIVARPVAWLTGFGLFFLASRPKILRLGLFEPAMVFGKYVPDPVAYSIAIAIFGFGYACVTGATFIWIQTKQVAVRSPNLPDSSED